MRAFALAFAAVAVAACNKTNPNYCDETTPCPNGGVCDLVDHSCSQVDAAGPPCESNANCSGQLPYCDTQGTHACMPCGPGGPSACAGQAPVCEDFTCRGCETDEECASGACFPDGSCADVDEVVYVSADGATGPCSEGTPCTLLEGVSAASASGGMKTTIKLLTRGGTFFLTDTIALPVNLTFTGRGALVRMQGTDGPAFLVEDLIGRFYFLGIESASNPSNGNGVRCESTGTVEIVGATLNRNTVQVYANNCTVTVDRSTLGGTTNAGRGIEVHESVLTLTRSTILDNPMGGALVQQSAFTVVNNFFRGAGGPSASFGAIRVQDTMAQPAGPHVLEFNTLVNNQAFLGDGVTGVDCLSNQIDLAFANNIMVNVDNDLPAAAGRCTHSYSIFRDGNPGATAVGNSSTLPTFVSTSDSHLAAGSAGTAAADPDATVPTDFDDEPRPNPAGGRADIGADEIP
jgi:hypothetical protein